MKDIAIALRIEEALLELQADIYKQYEKYHAEHRQELLDILHVMNRLSTIVTLMLREQKQ